jgi:hypothetical protein
MAEETTDGAARRIAARLRHIDQHPLVLSTARAIR